MPVELQALYGAVIVFFLTIGVQGALTVQIQGMPWGLGARDEAPDLSTLQKRAARTVANNSEALLMFAPMVLIAQVADISTQASQIGAVLFVAARAFYVPIYLMGIPYLRTLVWFLGMTGTIMVAYAVFSQGF